MDHQVDPVPDPNACWVGPEMLQPFHYNLDLRHLAKNQSYIFSFKTLYER